jgi:hypothetical protein
MAALRSLCDDEQAADDIVRCERDLLRLQFMPWKSESQRLEIERCIEVNRRHLARMRSAA